MSQTFKNLNPRFITFAPYLALGLSVFIFYANVYGNEFLFDDGLLITRNELLLHWSSFDRLLLASTTDGAHIAGGFYRPIQNILYFLIFQIFGTTDIGFHLLNVALHATNVCLLYKLGRKLNFNAYAVFFAALIWGLHPIHTEAVTYMSATADPLYATFCLLGLIIVLPDFSFKKICFVIPIYLLGLFSKEAMVVFPGLIMCCMFLRSDHPFKSKIYFLTWPLWILTGIYIYWRLNASYLDGPETYARIFEAHEYKNLKLYSENIAIRTYTFFATIPSYLSLIFWPQGLHMERDFRIYSKFQQQDVIEGAIICAIAILQVLFNSKGKAKPFSFGLLWFAAVHFPDTGILLPTNSLFLEHWMYLPLAGLCLGTAETISLSINKAENRFVRPSAAALSLLVALSLGVATFIQNMVWHDPVTFYTHLFKYGAVSARAHNNLALAYMERHEYKQAFDEFEKAIAITDTYAETRFNIAVSLLNVPDSEKNIPEAINNLEKSLAIDPHFYRSDVALSRIYDHLGDHEKATFYQQKAEENLKKFNPN